MQRALNAANANTKLSVSGVFNAATDTALRAYQKKVGLAVSGITTGPTWRKLRAGSR